LQDDDVFGQENDILEDAEELLGQMPGSDSVTFIQHGSSTQDEGGVNPLSDSMDDVSRGMPEMKPKVNRQISNSSSSKGLKSNFTDITNKGSSSLPAVNSARKHMNWQPLAALDQLGEEEEVLVITPPAVERTEVSRFDKSVDNYGESEEEDAFDTNAIAAPKFDDLPAVRHSSAYQTSVLQDEEPAGDPEDPWESLQNQYRIRADTRSPAEDSGRSKSGIRVNNSDADELVLDEESGHLNPVRNVRKESGRGRNGTRPSALPPVSKGPKEAKWGNGRMAQAGDIMLGRGALDEDYVPTDPLGFGGHGESNFSAGFVEYQGNEQSFDLDTMEVPQPEPRDIAMEDFTDDMMASAGAGKQQSSNIKLSLEEKLRQFEAQFDEDNYADEDLLREEMRLMTSGNDM